MFGLIFNASWIVREKMQLQQAVDYAALRGAYVQKVNLEYVREKNKKIQELFSETHSLLQIPNCWQIASVAQCEAVIAISTALTGKTASNCPQACSNYDSFIRARILDIHDLRYEKLLNETLGSVIGANAIAHEESKRYFFSAENIPFGLRNHLRRALGGNLSSREMVDLYDRGELSESLGLIDGQIDAEAGTLSPLFNFKMESKFFSYLNYVYPPNSGTGTCFCNPLPLYGIPTVRPAFRKVTRSDDEHSTYLFGAKYLRPETAVERTIKIVMRDPTREDRRALQSTTGKEANLIRREGYPMMAWAMAKPYGGEYPKASADPFNPFDGGRIGTTFQGIKLIGLADKAEQGTKLRVPPPDFYETWFGLQSISLAETLH